MKIIPPFPGTKFPDLIDAITTVKRAGMRRWFLSFTSHDLAPMQALKNALQQRDPESQIFLAPETMRAGGFWQQQLVDQIARSNAFVLLAGENGLGPWQIMEYYEALDRRAKEANYPLILVLFGKRAAAPGLPFVRQLHWVVTNDPASEATIGNLMDAATGSAARLGELWRHTRPYRGLEAMTEANSDFFFGRECETVEVINALAVEQGKLALLLGNSGVGKSSLAQAGVLGSLLRQTWSDHFKEAGHWPEAFNRSRHWCFLTLRPGTDPIKALVDVFLERWQLKAGAERLREQNELIGLLRHGKATLSDLLDQTEKRYRELGQSSPPAFLLYIDQGDELYVRAEKEQRRRFSEIVASGLADPRLRALMSLRSDFFGELQKDQPLHSVHRLVSVPPLREEALRGIVSRPAHLLSARFQTETLAADIARRTAEESAKDVGALPLLSYLLDDMWSEMVRRGDGVLRLPLQTIDLGRVLVERANRFVNEHPMSEDSLRRILTLKLATVREDGEPTRRRASRSEFSDDEWRLVSELADQPNRLLVTATRDGGDTHAEVAHEAIFRRWDRLREWIAAEREFLTWKTGLETARRAWQATPEVSKNEALLMGAALTQAQSWRAKRGADLPAIDREFISQSAKREGRAKARVRRLRTLTYLLLVGIILGLIAELNRDYVEERAVWYWTMRPYRIAKFDPFVLKPEAERTLKPGDAFRECAKDCPEMIVVPAGSFTMGSPDTETDRHPNEDPQHRVTITKPFAVSRFPVTFADWDACVMAGGCSQEGRAADAGWGRGNRPVIFVTWEDARAYAAWLSRMTGRTYRLLTEAEWEYAARAGAPTAYFWGDEVGKNNANCNGCGSQWDNRQTAPVGSFKPNAFGLYDMAGNVWQWVQDCYQQNYDGAPIDGSAWTSGDCNDRIIRGGSWSFNPVSLRSANRGWITTVNRDLYLGFRVARTLSDP